MKKEENLFLNIIIKNINLKYFAILKSKVFIITFFIVFGLGMTFTYQEMQRCYVKGNFQLNPIYTPPKILQNEPFIIKNIAKNFPNIKWNKQQFEISGPLKTPKQNFCVEQITEFQNKIDENYNKILQNIVPTMDQSDIYSLLEIFLVDNTDLLINENVQKKVELLRELYIKRQIQQMAANPDKYIIDWTEVNKMNFANTLRQIIIFSFYSLIFSLLFTTLFDFVRLVWSKQK